jgi:ATP-binding cassette subfamily B protein
MSRPLKSAWGYIGVYRGHLIAGAITLVLTSSFALAVPYVLGRIIDALSGDVPTEAVPPLAMAMIGLAIAQAITRIASRVSLFNAARHAEYDLRSDVFEHLMNLDAEFYRAHPTGDVMSRVTNDVSTVRGMWGPGLLNLINTGFLFAVALVLMVSIDWRLTAVSLIPYPSIVILGLWFGRRIHKTSREVQEKLGDLSNSIQEDLTGIGVIKTYHLEDHRAGHFGVESTELLIRNMRLTKVRGLLGPALGGIASLGTVMVLYVGANAVIDGRMNLGELVQFNAYLALLVWPTLALGWMFSLFQRGRASWERLEELLSAEPVVTGGERTLEPDKVRGDVELRSLRIERGAQVILDDVSLRCPAGTITCLVGRVGCGKTTVLETICRLVDIGPRQVFIDGIDITELDLGSLRSAIGYAPQEAFLFSTTIAENIKMGLDRRHRSPDDVDAAIAAAARTAGLTRDLEALPAGLETLVGERGITLSGGQRQRVALARAIATDPAVLILDDSLSSVDAETEREILGRLDEVMSGRTTIIVSHRVGVLKRADRIAVFDDGALVEVGSHDELLAAGGVYTELYRTQLEDV